MFGMLSGSFVFGLLSDNLGRKPTMLIGIIILSVSGSASAIFTTSFVFFAIMRFFSGVGQIATYMNAFMLVVEYVGSSYRIFTGTLIAVPFPLGGLIVGIISWFGVRNWRHLQLIFSAPLILLFFVLWWFVPESPRWLSAKGTMNNLEVFVYNIVFLCTTNSSFK